ncbi:hypothetical protein D3C87_1935990 [compost metagenome]
MFLGNSSRGSSSKSGDSVRNIVLTAMVNAAKPSSGGSASKKATKRFMKKA